MKLKRQTAKKLASLSAIGSGILIAGASEAQASVIIFDVTPNASVGFAPGAAANFSTHQPSHGSVGFSFSRYSPFSCTCAPGGPNPAFAGFQSLVGYGGGPASVMFAYNTNGLLLFEAGQTMGGANVTSSAGVAARVWFRYSSGSNGSTNTFSTHFIYGSPSQNNKYALFQFILNSELHYGWIELSVDNPDEFGPGIGPTLTVHRWAISDVANARVLAGTDTEQLNDVPEPSSFALTGLGALALGAAGVRRWRAAKKAA